MKKILLICLAAVILGCSQSDTSENSKNKSQDSSTVTEKDLTVKSPLPSDSIQWLANNVQDVLIDLYNYDASMTLTKDQGAKQAAFFISPDPVDFDISDCTPFAGIVYTGKEGVIYETEIFMDGQCSFIRFRNGNKIVHHNRITQDAFNFFSKVLKEYAPSTDEK